MQSMIMHIFGIFEKKDSKLTNFNSFLFDTIDNLLPILNSLKKKIIFVGNCGILYKDMLQLQLKNDIFFEEDTLVSSKYVGLCAFDRFKAGEILNSNNLSALYLKKSSAEEKLEEKHYDSQNALNAFRIWCYESNCSNNNQK